MSVVLSAKADDSSRAPTKDGTLTGVSCGSLDARRKQFCLPALPLDIVGVVLFLLSPHGEALFSGRTRTQALQAKNLKTTASCEGPSVWQVRLKIPLILC